MTSFANQLLTDCLIAQGMDPQRAAKTVSVVLETAVAAEIVERKTLDLWERDAMIYHRRGIGARPSDLETGFQMSRCSIFLIIRRHAKRRRAALRQIEEPLEMVG